MARRRECDIEAVLERATRLFWQRGYAGTSLTDIEAATGSSRTSIYAAFDDKEGLFLQVVDDYDRHYSAQLRAALRQAPTARAGVDAWFPRLLAALRPLLFRDRPAVPLVAAEGS